MARDPPTCTTWTPSFVFFISPYASMLNQLNIATRKRQPGKGESHCGVHPLSVGFPKDKNDLWFTCNAKRNAYIWLDGSTAFVCVKNHDVPFITRKVTTRWSGTNRSQESFATLHQTLQISGVRVCVWGERASTVGRAFAATRSSDQIDSLEWLQMKQYITFNQQQYVYSRYSTSFSDSRAWRITVSVSAWILIGSWSIFFDCQIKAEARV